MASQNEPVIIYGMDHSPWVQTVLMTCHFYSVPYRLMSRQLSFANYRRAGMIMPEVRFPDGRIVGDSFEIMREITGRYGLASADSLVQTEDISRLERLFFSYALRRGQPGQTDCLYPWLVESAKHRWLAHRILLSRADVLLLFRPDTGRSSTGSTVGVDPDHSETLLRLLKGWETRLGEEPFLAGAEPGLNDFALMGHIQCMATGLTEDVFAEVETFPKLWKWAGEMSKQLGDYPHNFARRLNEPGYVPTRATVNEQATFWATGLVGLAAWPVSLMAFSGTRFYVVGEIPIAAANVCADTGPLRLAFVSKVIHSAGKELRPWMTDFIQRLNLTSAPS